MCKSIEMRERVCSRAVMSMKGWNRECQNLLLMGAPIEQYYKDQFPYDKPVERLLDARQA